MARSRMQFGLKWLIGIAVLCGTLLGLWGARVEAQRERERAEMEKLIQETVKEWERIWFLDQPDHLSPPRTYGGIID